MPGHIPWIKIDRALYSFRSIWVSTTRPDGRPHAMPVWYVWDGRNIYFTSARTSQKARNLARQPWTIVHAGDGDDVIILEGAATIVTDPAEIARVNAAYMEKYVDPGSGAQATVDTVHDHLYRVNVRHVMAWEYGVVAHRTDWQFAAGLATGAP